MSVIRVFHTGSPLKLQYGKPKFWYDIQLAIILKHAFEKSIFSYLRSRVCRVEISGEDLGCLSGRLPEVGGKELRKKSFVTKSQIIPLQLRHKFWHWSRKLQKQTFSKVLSQNHKNIVTKKTNARKTKREKKKPLLPLFLSELPPPLRSSSLTAFCLKCVCV